MKKILTIISCGLYQPQNESTKSRVLIIKNKTKKFLRIFYKNEALKECEITIDKYKKIKIIIPINQVKLKLQWAETDRPTKKELFIPVSEKIKKITTFNKGENYGPLVISFNMGIKWS